ncbi:DNA mismatch repair endonuclease MutL [Risungbinella massiliensis]|uniref:DNA mismatch repair endonuclease MutL n=1 Tax=Risungbinella massiliensis TaxID=1329796 RepID=UPI0005CBE96A|nr:DNA mismatch repair endonuclease MutL [Risungbinella massiliensis]
MGKIQVLSEHLANQIAAGEVVERPASVVKELVENAIDAGASELLVELEDGGIAKIRIVDNGSGMESEDVPLAFERHATSKLLKERDLFQIRTLGFRGEALPSIASIARVELTSATDPTKPATKVQIEGGGPKKVSQVSHPRGTEVIVRDLFYNTPARLKYLKTVNTEISHVADYIGRMALAHPDISFTLRHEGRELFHSLGDGKLLHTILALYGKQVASRMTSIQAEDADFRVSGYIAKPEVTRSNRSYLTFLLNGRYVRSLPVHQTILQAYGTLLPIGRYPVVILQVTMDPKLCDVNVHPAKLEVRLSKEKELCQLVQIAIGKALGEQRLIPSSPTVSKKKESTIQGSFSFSSASKQFNDIKTSNPKHELLNERKKSYPEETIGIANLGKEQSKPNLIPFAESNSLDKFVKQTDKLSNVRLKEEGNETPETVLTQPVEKQPPQTETRIFTKPVLEVDNIEHNDILESAESAKERKEISFRQEHREQQSNEESHEKETFTEDKFPDSKEPKETYVPSLEIEDTSVGEKRDRLPRLQPLAQVHGTYIVAQGEDGFYLLDQHAAHERIYYEKFFQRLGEENQPQQPLLLPITLECSPSESQIIDSYLSILQGWGIEIDPFGGNTYLIRAVPSWFPQGEEEALFYEILDWLQEHGKVETAKLRDASAKMMACKAAIKANRHLRIEEMIALLDQMNECENPFTCPHGRPIYVHFSSYDLEKMFKRVM